MTMKKLYIVGLLLGSQLSLASYDKKQVRNLGQNVKEAVNTSFKKACKPEGLDALCAAFNMDDAKNLPTLTTIAGSDIQKTHSLSNNQLIDIWNLSRESIVAARKNRQPQGPDFFEILGEVLERKEASKKMTYGEKRIDRKLDDSKRRDLQAAWQLNPDKISPATDKGLAHCNDAIVHSNYQLNPTWQNWALTKGVDGQFLAASAVLVTVGVGAMCASNHSRLNRSVSGSLLLGGTISTGFGLSCLVISFDTDHFKFSSMRD